jgi:hypothetical protein
MPLIARASGSALFGVATVALGWAILRPPPADRHPAQR